MYILSKHKVARRLFGQTDRKQEEAGAKLLKPYFSSKSMVIKSRGMKWVNRGAQRVQITAA
jgi:hypothetical protein